MRVINIAPGFVRTNIHVGMGVSFEEYCRLAGVDSDQHHASRRDAVDVVDLGAKIHAMKQRAEHGGLLRCLLIEPERIADIILFCYKQPQAICIRDLVVMPTTSAY